ncbi:MAG: DUF4238 domain-containing protein [Anaerolineales bacterium]|nr:DUF4238 domain-containing protein [Anaerolineales bacterium]
MPLHHFLPATYLASFSSEAIPERRKRMLTVGDKETGKIITAPASKLCGINDLYTLTDNPKDSQLIDSIWTYENKLSPALDLLIHRSLDAMTWADTLIPFVTDLLVRGPDFNRRFEARIESLGVSSLVSPDNTNLARLMERQRLYSSVAASKWVVVHKNGDIPIITNDLGYTTFGNPNTGDSGIAVPLGLDHILCLSPKLKKVLAYGINGVWLPNIEYVESPRDDHLGFNHAITRLSKQFIFGPDRHSIEIFLPKQKTETLPVPEPGQLGFMDGVLAMVHDMTMFKLITALSTPPNEDTFIYVDYLKKENIPPEFRDDIFGRR